MVIQPSHTSVHESLCKWRAPSWWFRSLTIRAWSRAISTRGKGLTPQCSPPAWDVICSTRLHNTRRERNNDLMIWSFVRNGLDFAERFVDYLSTLCASEMWKVSKSHCLLPWEMIVVSLLLLLWNKITRCWKNFDKRSLRDVSQSLATKLFQPFDILYYISLREQHWGQTGWDLIVNNSLSHSHAFWLQSSDAYIHRPVNHLCGWWTVVLLPGQCCSLLSWSKKVGTLVLAG